jgi:hypothetical protein
MTLETTPFVRAMNAGLRRAMEEDGRVLLMGEDIGKLGGVFRVTEHLQRDFGEDRVLDTPLAEAGIVGTAPSSRSSSTASCFPPSTRSRRSSRSSRTVTRVRSRCPS